MIDSRHLDNRVATRDSRQDPDADERFVEPADLAAHWGVHVQTVYRDIRKGALPSLRLPGGRLRIRWSDARRYGRPNE